MSTTRSRSSFWWTIMIGGFIGAVILMSYGVVQYFTPPPSPATDSSVVTDGTREPVIETAPALPEPSGTTQPPSCTTATKPFVPQTVRVTGKRYPVQALDPIKKADADGGEYFVSPDPLNDNPGVFAWDRTSAKSGARQGKASLTAHTYSAGSALGNQLLASLKAGDRLVLIGSDVRTCYRVSERVELPVGDYPSGRVYDMAGKHQTVITVCSGYNPATGVWDKRTIWFAEPVK